MTKKKNKKNTPNVTVRPRLVKADELAAREAAAVAEQEARKTELKAKAQTINPALRRTPRNAVEARDMFNALFNEAA